MRTAARGLAAAVAAAALLGCGDPAGQVLGVDESAVVTVGEGVSPLYAWTGAPGRRLVVTDVASGDVVWDVRAFDDGLGFLSPVEHGIPPQGAQEFVNGTFLETGIRYRVEVTRTEGGAASAEFIP